MTIRKTRASTDQNTPKRQMVSHIERDKDYALTGIEVCDLLSIAHELETAKHLPAEMRGAIARQMRLILARAVVQDRRGPGGRHPK